MTPEQTANPFAALLRDVSRRVIEDGGDALYHGKRTTYLPETEVLAALAAVPADLAEAGKVLERLAVRTSKRLAPNWKEGRKCPECDADAMRQKCMWEMGGACPRHDPSNYEPSPYEVVPDRDCKEAADLITTLLARLAAQEAQIKGLEKDRDRRTEMHECAMSERDDATLYADEQKARAEAAETTLAASEARVSKLLEALRATLRFIENTESELGITMDSGNLARAAITEATQ